MSKMDEPPPPYAAPYPEPGSPHMVDTQPVHHQQSGFSPDVDFVKSVPGILKIVEMALCFITFICIVASPTYFWGGSGWVDFVAMSALITTLIFFLFHLLRVIHRFNAPWLLIEFIYYCVYTGLLLIAAIVAAVGAHYNSGIAAGTFFCFAATVIYGIDTFLQFQNWRNAGMPTGGTVTTTHQQTTVVTSTTTTY